MLMKAGDACDGFPANTAWAGLYLILLGPNKWLCLGQDHGAFSDMQTPTSPTMVRCVHRQPVILKRAVHYVWKSDLYIEDPYIVK